MLSLLRELYARLPLSPLIILLGTLVSYHVLRSIYLIYFSPLSIFPGSKWAAIGEYWEAYWNIGVTPGRKGQTLFKLEKMHHELGTAIRLGPNEVHIYDPNFYHELYRVGSKYYKDPDLHKVFGAPSSTVAECDPRKHKIRRAPLESLFAKVNTNKLEPSLLQNLDFLSKRFDSMYAAGKPVNMEWALKSLTMDTVSQFIFGTSFNAMEDPNFQALPVRVFVRYLMSLHVIKAFPFVRYLSNLPLWLARLIAEDVANGHELERLTAEKIDDFIAEKENGKMPAFPTVMERLLTSMPEKDYYVPSKLGIRDEVLTLLSAGNDTTAISTMVTLFNVINNPAIHSRLLAELKTVMPKPESYGPYSELESLPYLSAVIKEGLRYASPAASRTPRLVPPGGVRLPDGRFIPEGTRVGMAIYHIHYNEAIFTNPRKFDPERWLKPAEEISEQNKFMVAFSRGNRSCIGINLAYMELYVFIAHILRRFELVSAGTTEKDMAWDDMVIPQFHGEFKVMTKRRTE